ncbi:MAG: AAA family ATPase, partial [Armatimonadetes bacterium]|nr:AAA family ATPase [Armatimonadota bacterium]
PLTISGSVSAAENDSALMTVQRLVWGDKTVYAHDGMKVVDAVVSGLPTVVQNTLVVGLTCFLEASVVVINSHRFLSQEVEAPHSGTAFQAGNFKNTLHNLSLSRERHRDFAEIAQLFANEPFTYGNLSFARTDGDQGDNLELMVQSSDELRIPVDRLGSGVQQVLVIIANLVANRKKKVFGLEEPEINLSPRSQVELRNKLMEFINLKSYVHQLFITSHSDIFGPDRGLSVCLLAHDGVETVVISEDERAERLKHHFGYRPSPKYCLYDCPTREQIPKRRRDEACWDCLQYANKDGVTPAEWEKYRGALPGKFGF